MSEEFSVEELEGALKRAYEKDPDLPILFDGHQARNRFLSESLRYGLECGWIQKSGEYDEDSSLGRGRGQYLCEFYEFTEEGRKYFGSSD